MTGSADRFHAEKALEKRHYALTRQVPDMAHGCWHRLNIEPPEVRTKTWTG
jgi:uncharacterized cupredoxin-like copper-binding protein